MTSKPMVRKKLGSKRSGDAAKDLIIDELKDRVVILENELRSCREKTIPIDVVDRERAEEALRAGEERYRGLIESTGDWIWEINEDFVLTYHSPMGWKILGYGPDEVIGKDPYSFVPEAELERVRSIAGPAIERHEPIIRIEIRLLKKDGSIATIETTAIPIFDESGRYRGYRGVNHDITERKRTEEALRESEEKFRALAESAKAGIILTRADKFIYVNPETIKDLGYMKDELLAMKFWDVVHPDSRELVRSQGLKLLQGLPAPSTYEIKVLTKGGKTLWEELTATIIDYMGEPTILITSFNITERKRAEEALWASEEKFRLMADFTYDWESWIGPTGEYVYVSPSCERVTGHSRDEFYRDTGLLMKMIHPDDRAAYEHHRKCHFIPDFDLSGADFRIVTADGETRWISHRCQSVYGKNGERLGRRSSNRDVTNRKRADEALMKSEYELNKAQRIAHLGNWEWDLASNMVRGSDELYRMFGLAPGLETPLDHFIEHVAPEDRQRLMNALGETVKYNKPFDMEYQVLLPDGTRRFIDDKAEVSYEDGRPATVFGTVLDITERKRVENELKVAKMQADLYVDLMSHDIGNMNQVGLGFLEMALDILELDDMGREMLLKPRSAFENSSKLIDNVRKLQKARSGEYPGREMDIGQVLGKVRDHYSKQYGPNVTINYLMSPGCMVKANELLYDLFSNLVENAIKHAKAHPIININVELVRENGRDYHKVTIDDQGPGIPDELKAMIFERKLTGDIKSKGSGIGLYMVKTLVDIYQGRVWVEDRVPGDRMKGARFVVMLPAVEK